MTQRPLPVVDARSAGYWRHAARHELALARCAQCARRSHPPDLVCPHCGSIHPDWSFEPVSGHGVIRSWTVVRRSFLPGFDVPFVLVDVELTDVDPDLRLIGRLLGAPATTALPIGSRVRVAFEDVAPGVAVPAFVLDDAP